MQTNQLKGVLVMLMTVLIWGATFPVAKSALQSMDAFWMSGIRYGIATPLFVVILCSREGTAALDYRGSFLRASLFGVIGLTAGLMIVPALTLGPIVEGLMN